MIIINAGLPKTGTTLLFQYQIELISRKYGPKPKQIFDKYSIGGYVERLDFKTTLILLWINFIYGGVAVKIHQSPNKYIKWLINLGIAHATFCIRDPRDILLSLVDYGAMLRERKKFSNVMSAIFTNDQAVSKIVKLNSVYLDWLRFGKADIFKYEYLIQEQFFILSNLASRYKFAMSEDSIREIVIKYEKSGFNFNKGRANRYLTEWSTDEIRQYSEVFRNMISSMGYAQDPT